MVRRTPQRSRNCGTQRRSAAVNVVRLRDQVKAASNIYYMLRAELEEESSEYFGVEGDHVITADFGKNASSDRPMKPRQIIGILGSDAVH
ncbi:MAG: hypothetical protein KDD64_10880 [Bdellovibrionales bacterium]|nr:hypothetical protein [Bdellovibrionales bacterium]